MGIKLFRFSSSSYDNPTPRSYDNPAPPNPNPTNYVVEKAFEGNYFLVVMVRYPDCTNYEGRKILVYRGVTLKGLLGQRSIDPHFSDNSNFYSPIARFVPTEEGWGMAMNFILAEGETRESS